MTQVKKFARFPVIASAVFLIMLACSLPARAQTIVCLETTLGDICMELLESEAPVTAQNFLTYLQQGSYRESFFHISNQEGPSFLQVGRFVDTGTGGNSALVEIFKLPPISNESSVSNLRGTVAAVPDDPSNPDSTTSQFLINVTDNPEFDTTNGGYTVFARLIGRSLEDVVDIMAAFPAITLGLEGLTRVPVIDVLSPAVDSPRFIIFNAYVFDGDLDDFLNNNGGDGGTDGGDGGTDGGDGGGTDGGDGGTDGGDGGTTDPGDGTLYEDAVCVDTNVGEFCMALFPDRAPATVENFLNYVTSGRYDNTIVHRSVPNFVIQAGGYTAEPLGAGIQRDPVVQNEFGLSNLRATVAMARIGGQVNSATSEWFVNLVNNSQLDFVDGGFTVFAEVISGMSVVDAISNLPRTNQQNFLGNAFGELPVTDQDNDGLDADDLVLINRVYVTDVIVSDTDNGSGGDGGSGVTTTATYQAQSRSFTMPVYVGDSLYRIIMRQALDDVLTFSVDTSRIISLTDVGQETATMDLDAGTLVIPSVDVNGKVFNDVTFELTVYDTLTFRLTGFTRAAE